MASGRWRRRPPSRSTCALVVYAVILAACSNPSTATTTTTVALDTVSDPTTTTTTAEEEPVDICGDRTAWEPGVTHRATCFIVPLSFTPDEPGWRATRATLEAIEGQWTPPERSSEVLRFVILAFMPDATPREALEAILAIDGVNARAAVAADSSAVRVDVDTAPTPGSQTAFDRDQCADSGELDIGGQPGYILLDLMSLSGDGGALYGLGACRTFRLWSLGIEGETLTIIASTEDPDRFDELMPMMDHLVASITVASP